jgi:hypothetical protein
MRLFSFTLDAKETLLAVDGILIWTMQGEISQICLSRAVVA